MAHETFKNQILAQLSDAITDVTTDILIDKPAAPWSAPENPATGAGRLTLIDALVLPTKSEIITYTGVADFPTYVQLIGVVRGVEGTTAQAFDAGAFGFQALTAEKAQAYEDHIHAVAAAHTAAMIASDASGSIAATNVQSALIELDQEKQPLIPTGTVSQYYRGDKSWTGLTASAVANVPAHGIAAVTVQEALSELAQEKEPIVAAGNAAHYYRGDKAWAAIPALQVVNTPADDILSINVQDALNELDQKKSATTHVHLASAITNTPAGNIAATTVQAALNELDDEKLPNTTSLTDIGADLVDADEFPVYDASATANRKSLLSRIWTYISGKLATYLASPPVIGGTTPAPGIFTSIDIRSNNDNPWSPGYAIYKQRGSVSAPTIVMDKDQCGPIYGWAYDGANYRSVAAFDFYVDGTPSAGVMPGGIYFYTNRGGAGLSFAMTINSSGNLLIGTTTDAGQKLQVAGNAYTSGYSQLGESAPSIKMKKLTGTTASTEGGETAIAHGLTSSKIIGVQVFVAQGGGFGTSGNYQGASGYQYSWGFNITDMIVNLHPTNSENILSKPFTVLITYEE